MDREYRIQLTCATCGDADLFEFNDDKSYIKCVKCGRKYPGGYDELVQLNEETIEDSIEEIKTEVKNDIVEQINKAINKKINIKLKL